MEAQEPDSSIHTSFFSNGLSIPYLKKMCYVSQSIFWHAVTAATTITT